MPKTDLADLLEQLDEETRVRWAKYLESVDREITDKGPVAAKEHLDAALSHLLAVGWALRCCYSAEEVLGLLGEAASTVEHLRSALDSMSKKPEWSQ